MKLKAPRSLVIAILTLGMCQLSQAALTITVTGDATGTGTIWTFNGTSTALAGLTLGPGGISTDINFYEHIAGDLTGELYSDANHNNVRYNDSGTYLSGSAVGSSSGAFFFDGLYLDSDGADGGDDFAWTPGSYSEVVEDRHTFIADETLTFTNYKFASVLDITTFGEGASAIVNNGDSFTVSSTSEPIANLTMTFTAIPEPSASLLLGIGALGFLARRKRG